MPGDVSEKRRTRGVHSTSVAELQAISAGLSTPKPTAPATKRRPKITLEAWGQLHYCPPPNMDTLRRWARDLKIYPFPQKVGRTYYVDPDAEYREHRQHGT